VTAHRQRVGLLLEGLCFGRFLSSNGFFLVALGLGELKLQVLGLQGRVKVPFWVVEGEPREGREEIKKMK
jgi:hypothetical protein